MGAKREYFYGGQAVLEGVMMRGPKSWAIAVRRPSQEIYVEHNPLKGLAAKREIWKKPLFRGVAALGEAMTIGVRALSISANQSLDEDEQLTPRQMAFSLALAFVFFIGVFIVLPTIGVGFLRKRTHNSLVSNLIEGGVRLGIFVGYLTAISFIKDIRRVFMYHGAEHKTIAAHEAGEQQLTPEAVDKYSTLHVRCGTNFLIMVMMLTIIIYSFLGYPVWYWRVLQRVSLIPVIAGISYEGLRLGANHLDNFFVRALMKPGIWLQMITTKPPTPDQIEVAIRSFEAVLPREEAERLVPSLPSAIFDGGSSIQPGWVPEDRAEPQPEPGPVEDRS
ncbi:MAG TPA: DUF1385 domain-containing protein [Actinomycetota bacterium]